MARRWMTRPSWIWGCSRVFDSDYDEFFERLARGDLAAHSPEADGPDGTARRTHRRGTDDVAGSSGAPGSQRGPVSGRARALVGALAGLALAGSVAIAVVAVRPRDPSVETREARPYRAPATEQSGSDSARTARRGSPATRAARRRPRARGAGRSDGRRRAPPRRPGRRRPKARPTSEPSAAPAPVSRPPSVASTQSAPPPPPSGAGCEFGFEPC